MDDNVILFGKAKKEKEHKSDAAKLRKIGLLIEDIENQEDRERLMDAWLKASIRFFSSQPLPD